MPPEPLINLYRVLGVPEDADDATIQSAYRRLAKAHHPDSGGDPAKFAALTEAKAILTDPARRAGLDAALAASRQPPPGPGTYAPFAPAPPPPGWGPPVSTPPPPAPRVPPAYGPPAVPDAASYRSAARRLRILQLVTAGLAAALWYLALAAHTVAHLAGHHLETPKLTHSIFHAVGPVHLPIAGLFFLGGMLLEQFTGPLLRLWVLRPAPLRHTVIVLLLAVLVGLPYLTTPGVLVVIVLVTIGAFLVSAALAAHHWGRQWYRAP